MNNLLLGEETRTAGWMLTLSDGANRFSCPIVPPCCGEIVISCRETGLCDLLHLFRERVVAPFDEVRTVIRARCSSSLRCRAMRSARRATAV